MIYTARGVTSVEDWVDGVLADKETSAIEGHLGTWMEEVARIVSGGFKPGSGVDLQRDRPDDPQTVELYAIQSAPSTKNAGSRRSDVNALRTAAASAVIAVLLSVTDAQEANDSAAEFVHGRELVGQINAGKAGILERLLAREDVLAGRLDAAVAALERSVSELASNLGVDDVETLRARQRLGRCPP